MKRMEEELSEGIGMIEEISPKTTKMGKNYVLYKISGVFISDFTAKSWNVQVGDKVSYVYSVSGSEGQFKNLESITRLAKDDARMNTEISQAEVLSYTSPAFFGMIANQAVEWSLKLSLDVTKEEMLKRFEDKFDLLWELWSRKKLEKKVN